MSTLNLENSVDNSQMPCTVTGAISGNSSITFSRMNGTVFLSFPEFTGTSATTNQIVYTYNLSLPQKYVPVSNTGISPTKYMEVVIVSNASSSPKLYTPGIAAITSTAVTIRLPASANFPAGQVGVGGCSCAYNVLQSNQNL